MAGQVIGYVRVSTVDQNTERQLDGIHLDKVFEDKASGSSTERPELTKLLEHIREGDTVLVHDISRLARSIEDLLRLVKEITSKGCTLEFKKEGLRFTNDTSNPMNNLMLSLLGSVYEFERAMLLERQREGIAKAKEAGKYKGRQSKLNTAKVEELLNSGLSLSKTAEAMGVSVSTVKRVKKKLREE